MNIEELEKIIDLVDEARRELHLLRPHGDEELRVAAQKLMDVQRILEHRAK